MSNISADGLHLGTTLCLAAIFGPLKKRGLITNGEVEEAIRKCSDLVIQGVANGLNGVVAGDACLVMSNFLQVIIPAGNPAPLDETAKLPLWFEGIIDGGKKST
jgi:hypothetical protein